MLAKIKNKTNHFNTNQKCFILQDTGDRVRVRGKYRSKHRYVSAWVDKANLINIRNIDVTAEFEDKILYGKSFNGRI